ncbi:YkvA family protein [Heyndrickxia sp. NPDC080065]|uniref:YkvA family protein n=1 Tax=Heyndrickxia sp. NPDC080065 TaxID=3390568 RepID=UPI003D0901C3
MANKSNKWKELVQNIKRNIYILYLANRHPGTPWYAKAFSILIVAYALSPIDIIPDFIPILGYVDEAILLPIGILGAFSMIPKSILEECKAIASQNSTKLRKNWAAAIVILLVWISLAASILFTLIT